MDDTEENLLNLAASVCTALLAQLGALRQNTDHEQAAMYLRDAERAILQAQTHYNVASMTAFKARQARARL